MRLFSLIKYAVAIGLITFLISWAGPQQILFTLSQTKIEWVAISIGFLLMTFLPGTLGLYVLLMPLKKKIPFRKIAEYYSSTWALGNLLPGRIGSFYIVYLLKKEKIDLGPSSAIFIIDKLVTLSTVILTSIIGLVWLFGSEGIAASLLLLALLIAGTVALFSKIGRDLIKNYIIRGYSKNFKGFFSTTKAYFTKNWPAIAKNYKWTIVKLFLDSMVIWSMFNAIGLTIPIQYIITIYCATAIATFIPITLNGLGIREGASVLLYNQVGANAAQVISVYLLIYFYNLVISGIIVLLFVKAEHVSMKELGKMVKK